MRGSRATLYEGSISGTIHYVDLIWADGSCDIDGVLGESIDCR
jgi:hypothetical protein